MPDLVPDLDVLFGYQPPTRRQKRHYDALKSRLIEVVEVIRDVEEVVVAGDAGFTPGYYAQINTATKAFAAAVLERCPVCVDRAAAIDHIRLCRNALNEIVAADTLGRATLLLSPAELVEEARRQLLRSRFRAHAAIALSGAR